MEISITRPIFIGLALMISSCTTENMNQMECNFRASIFPLRSEYIYHIEMSKNSSEGYNFSYVIKSRRGEVERVLRGYLLGEDAERFCKDIIKEHSRPVAGYERRLMLDYPSVKYKILYKNKSYKFDSDNSDHDSMNVEHVNNELRKLVIGVLGDRSIPNQIDWSD